MKRQCPRCGETVIYERSERPNPGPVHRPRIVDMWFRCGNCGLRVDSSGIGDADAQADMDKRLRDDDRTRKISVPAQRRPRRRR